jgi:NAD(P)-dependent dehydrogenase (short-subunit alcohol dehydrogenase family)
MKTYLIIGGSKGITKETVKLLSANSDFCYIISQTKPDFNYNGEHFALNVLQGELPQLPQLDGIVYGVGTINLKPFNRLTTEDYKNDMEVNFFGAVKVIQNYLPNIKASESASIVLFSSIAAQRGMSFHASVAAAKGAVEGFTKSLAAELAPKIRVNAIAPSIVNTPLASGILRNEKIVENMEAKHPLKRILQPEDVAQTVKFLLDDTSKGITGQIFIQDNGLISLNY